MAREVTFKDYAVVACGTMMPELNHLKETGFLDAAVVLYTTPGLHQEPLELEKQLVRQVNTAKGHAKKIIIVYGSTYCYININNPTRTIDTVVDELREDGYFISRTRMHNCIDMVASDEEREQIAGGEKIWFATPGWIKYHDLEFKGWDRATANENFPRYSGGGLVLDAVGFCERYREENTEDLLNFSDWAGIPIMGHDVSLDRIKSVLVAALDEADRPGA